MAQDVSAPVDPTDRARDLYRRMTELTVVYDEVEAHALTDQTCGYFATCANQAVGHIHNPFTGPVPACNRCRTTVGASWMVWLT